MQVGRIIADRAGAEIISCSKDIPLREAVRLLAEKRIGALPVMEDGRVIGIVSERDLLYCLAAEGEASLAKPVAEVMTSPPITVSREANAIEALALMTRRRIRHLPVVDGDVMSGFVSIGDLVKSRLEEISHEAEAMREYIRMA